MSHIANHELVESRAGPLWPVEIGDVLINLYIYIHTYIYVYI